MTIAEQIKRSTKPFSVSRSVECADNCVIHRITDYGNVWVGEYWFIDGSTLTHRGYF